MLLKIFLPAWVCICFFAIDSNYSDPVSSFRKVAEDYRCTPCGSSCDEEIYTAPGNCSHCQMPLVKKSTIHFNNIAPGDICAYIKKHPGVILLDVRTKEEFEGRAEPNFGTLKNAINLPVQELQAKLSTLAAYKEKDIIVFCSHSHRSPQASYLLTQNGFNRVTNMSGGMSVMEDSSCRK
ncbi:MAG: rhodanese-like domain-containing protein [Bacteroidota bacterium]